nr:S24 family peptidase [Cetobacterium somerae]
MAVKIDVVSSLLSRLENGKVLKVNPFLLKKISEGLKINYKELYKIVGYLEEDEEIPKVETKLVELPVYGRAAAGNGYINMENIIRTEYLVAIPGEDFPKGAFIAEVYGESMFPTLLDGDFAIVDPDCNDKNINNQICVVTYNGQTFIKRIVRKEKYVVLMSDNPDRVKYEDIIVPTDEYSDLVCHGIVIECRRKFKRR